MEHNAVHVFARVAGFALIAAAIIMMVEGIWWFAIICLVLFVAIGVLETITIVRNHRTHERPR